MEFCSNYFLKVTRRKHILWAQSENKTRVSQLCQVRQQRSGRTKYKVFLVWKWGRIPHFIGMEALETLVRFACACKRDRRRSSKGCSLVIHRSTRSSGFVSWARLSRGWIERLRKCCGAITWRFWCESKRTIWTPCFKASREMPWRQAETIVFGEHKCKCKRTARHCRSSWSCRRADGANEQVTSYSPKSS